VYLQTTMLRELVECARDDAQACRTTSVRAGPGRRLLVLHHRRPRVVALARALAEAGYTILEAADDHDARSLIDGGGPPDALLTVAGRGQPMSGLVFGRECLARLPGLRVLYVTPLPWPSAVPLVCGERRLQIPFSGADLTAALDRESSDLPAGQITTAAR
jgi:hypothetical protein